jgi:hypothetical protein
MSGVGSEQPKLIVFIDNPTKEEDYKHKAGSSKTIELIQWLFARMSLSPSDIRIEFTVRCHAEKKDFKKQESFIPCVDGCSIHTLATLQKYPKAILIAMGSLSCYQFIGKVKHGQYSDCKWKFSEKPDREIWITYAPGAALQAPSESTGIYRVFWCAAKEAGLNPSFNNKLQLFSFDV